MKKIVTTSLLVLVSMGAFAETFAPQKGELEYSLIQSTKSYMYQNRLGTPFSHHYVSDLRTIDLDGASASHVFQGIGVCMTDASCWMVEKLGPEKGQQLLQDAFGKDGLNLSVMRLNCGASDYATALYNYDDVKDDVKMIHFDVSRDEQYMIPVLKRAMDCQKDMYVFSSIWSVPGWMKTSGEMCGGLLLDKYLPAFANYWAAYCREYEKRGVHIDAITVQNEPLTDQRGANPATLISQEQEALLIGKYLPESFSKAGVKPQIWCFDHNYKNYERVLYLLADENARKHIDAIAWHPYRGTPDVLPLVRAKYPDVPMHLTERGMNYHDSFQNEKWCADLVFDALNNGCSTYTAWNLALDTDGQPLTGKFHCRGLFEVSLDYTSYNPTPLCTIFRHVGAYVKKNAQIMSVYQANENVKTIVFKNPDGEFVIVAACDNLGAERQRLQIKYKGQYMIVSLPMHTWSVSTIVVKP